MTPDDEEVRFNCPTSGALAPLRYLRCTFALASNDDLGAANDSYDIVSPSIWFAALLFTLTLFSSSPFPQCGAPVKPQSDTSLY